MRTYEKGVEGETFACGTGALAAFYVASQGRKVGDQCKVVFATSLHNLHFKRMNNQETVMEGEAVFVYSGLAKIEHPSVS